MYGSLATDDTYKRADGIFKSMIEIFNPNMKEYITHGKTFERTTVEEGKSTKACQSSAVKIGIAATLSPGCKDVGKCIMDITDALQEVNMAKDTWMKKFGNDVLYSMEQRYEQDGKYIVGLRKKYQDEFKGKTNEAEKAMASVTKLKKRSMNKPSSLKSDSKLQRTYEKLHSAKAATEVVAHEMLSRAFLEERRRYCYFVERQCQAVQALIEYCETSAEILKSNLDEWTKVGNSQDDLLPGAIALLESSKGRHSTSDGDDLYPEASVQRSGTSVSLTSKRSSKLRDPKTSQERRPLSMASAPQIDVYNNPYRTTSSACLVKDDALTDLSTIENKDYFNLTEDKLTLPVYASISKSADMVFTHDSVRLREKTKSDVPRRHVSESVDVEGWSVPGGRLEPRQSPFEMLKDRNVCSDTDDGDVFESPKIDKNQKHDSDRVHDDAVEHEQCNKIVETCPTPSITTFESLYDYLPGLDGNKLELYRGDKIIASGGGTIVGGWLYGENVRTGMKGWFPENYCKESEADKKSSPNGGTDITFTKRNGSSRDTTNIFRFSRDVERALLEGKKNKNGRQSWQL